MRFAVIDGANESLAVVAGCMVDNVIVLNESQKDEMEAALGKPLLPAAPLGLEPGDMFSGANWTRNVEGEQVGLPIERDSADVAQFMAIVHGEVE